MKFYDNDDDLERALFALDLEEPPAGLRQAILSSTIYHAPAAPTVRAWEPWLYGALCTALVWLLVIVVHGNATGAVSAAASYGDDVLAFFSQSTTLLWIAVGGAATVWISQMNLTVFPGYQRATRR